MSNIDLGLWISEYGQWLVFFVTFASCLALPVPASLVMMTAGTFAAADELNLYSLIAAGTLGAVTGDQTGYHLARRLFEGNGFLTRSEKLKANIHKAAVFQEKWGSISVFFSRWLASPLGPWVNFTSGLTGFNHAKFTLWGIAGEIVWVSLYVSLGYLFSAQIQEIADITANAIWILIAGGLAWWIGKKLFSQVQQDNFDA